MSPSLEVFVPDALWLREYAVGLGGARFNARMTVIKLRSGEVVVHSPCAFDDSLAAEVAALGPVAAIIAPGNFHWLHVASCQRAFPNAVTYVCPGVEKRAKDLRFALPNARVMVHQPSGGFQGQATDIMLHAQEILNLKKRLNEIYVKHTGQSLKKIEDALERDYFLTAEAAKDFGLVDKVIDKRPEELLPKSS